MEEAQETLTFKSDKERDSALNTIESDPPSNLKSEEDVNNWIADQEEKQNRILEAEIVSEPEETPPEPQAAEEAPPEPQVQEEPPVEEPQVPPEPPVEETPPPQEEDVVQFSYKRDDLPESLQGYKDPQEIIRQADHARRFANKAEESMKEMAKEKEKMALELEEYKKQREQKVSAAPEVSPETEPTDLAAQLQKIDSMEDSDYMSAGEIKSVLGLAVDEIKNTRKEFSELKTDFGGKLTNIEKANEASIKKDEDARQQDATVRGISELQDKYPELQTNKPISSIMGDADCVERDVMQWADRLLFSKYGNDKPSWSERNAVVNAYLGGNSEVEAYCQQNAITPESVGTTAEDMERYATIMSIDANMRGEEIDSITGERKQKISPFNGKPVNHDSYISSYQNLKDSTGITLQEQKEKIAKAEMLGQQSLTEALEVRAATPKTLSDKGSTPPEAVKEMDKDAAWKIIDNVDEFKMEQEALKGNRSLFYEYNKAQKMVGFPEAQSPEHWPPEKK